MENSIRVLIVCSGNSNSVIPFIKEQVEAIGNLGIKTEYFIIKGKGILGYLKNLIPLKVKIKKFNPDLIHAHYGLSGLLAILQLKIKVIITYHGSDLNDKNARFLSFLAYKRASMSIFVTPKIAYLIKAKHPIIIPCGVNTKVFFPKNKEDAREKFGYRSSEKLVVFSSSFDNKVKNFPLAMEAIEILKKKKYSIRLIELKGYSREKVSLILNASDVALMTSFTEGSPQFIKEAMACNVPIVSTDVGDVTWLLEGVEGCFITSYKLNDVAEKLILAINFARNNGKTNGRKRINELKLDSFSVSKKIREVYYNTIGTN